MKVRDDVAVDEIGPSLIPTFSLEGRRGVITAVPEVAIE
jgi:hypothetical protein